MYHLRPAAQALGQTVAPPAGPGPAPTPSGSSLAGQGQGQGFHEGGEKRDREHAHGQHESQDHEHEQEQERYRQLHHQPQHEHQQDDQSHSRAQNTYSSAFPQTHNPHDPTLPSPIPPSTTHPQPHLQPQAAPALPRHDGETEGNHSSHSSHASHLTQNPAHASASAEGESEQAASGLMPVPSVAAPRPPGSMGIGGRGGNWSHAPIASQSYAYAEAVASRQNPQAFDLPRPRPLQRAFESEGEGSVPSRISDGVSYPGTTQALPALSPPRTAAQPPSLYSAPTRDQRRATLPLAHTDLELELQIRHNMLVEQQHKIGQLEGELAKSRMEVERLAAKVRQHEQDRAKGTPKKAQSRYWTPEEHQRFLEGVEKFGAKDVKSIAAHVGSRNPTQVRTHAQKYYLRIDREKKRNEEREQKELDEKTKRPPEGPAKFDVELAKIGNERKDGQNGDTEEVENETDLYEPDYSVLDATDTSTSAHILRAAALSSVPGWDAEEYEIFVNALSHAPAETNDEKRLAIVQDMYLPHKPMDELIAMHEYRRNFLEKQKRATPSQLKENDALSHKRARTDSASFSGAVSHQGNIYGRPWEPSLARPQVVDHPPRRMSLPALPPTSGYCLPPPQQPQTFYPTPLPAPVPTAAYFRRMSAPNLAPLIGGGAEARLTSPAYMRHRLSLPGEVPPGYSAQDRHGGPRDHFDQSAAPGGVWSSRVLGVVDTDPEASVPTFARPAPGTAHPSPLVP